MTRRSIRLTHRLQTLLRRSRSAWIVLGLALLVSPTVWTQSAGASPTSDDSEAANAYRLGMSLVKAGHLDEAITSFKDGLSTNPQSAILLNVIGATYSLKGNFEQAENYLIKCLRVDPEFVPARKNLAISYFNSGKYDLAITEFERLSKVAGDSRSVAFLFLGIIAEKQGNFSKSVSLLGEPGALVYQYPEALLSLARSHLELEQVEKADEVLKALDTMSGVTAVEHFRVGQLYSRQRQYHQALAEFDKADKLDRGLAELQFQR